MIGVARFLPRLFCEFGTGFAILKSNHKKMDEKVMIRARKTTIMLFENEKSLGIKIKFTDFATTYRRYYKLLSEELRTNEIRNSLQDN